MGKVENYKLKKLQKKIRSYTKWIKNIKFNDTEIEEYKFHQYKSPISIINMDINKIVVSNKLPFGNQDFRYFIGFKDAKKVKPLYIFLSKMRIDKRDFDKTIYLINVFIFFIKDENFLEKYNEIWEKVSNIKK